jgi:hypothetical protein
VAAFDEIFVCDDSQPHLAREALSDTCWASGPRVLLYAGDDSHNGLLLGVGVPQCGPTAQPAISNAAQL